MRVPAVCLPILAWLCACAIEEPDGSGIAIGNPPGGASADARVVVADGDDVFMTDFALELRGVYVEDCDGNGRVLRVPEGKTLSFAEPSLVEVPPGLWCGIGLVPTERAAVLTGDVEQGSFRFEGALGRILLYGEFEVARGEPLVLELGEPGWVRAADFPVRPGEELLVGGPDCLEDRLCLRIRAGLMNRAGLYRDRDADGEVNEDERERGTDASGDSRRQRKAP